MRRGRIIHVIEIGDPDKVQRAYSNLRFFMGNGGVTALQNNMTQGIAEWKRAARARTPRPWSLL
jgi:hypothetical protein